MERKTKGKGEKWLFKNRSKISWRWRETEKGKKHLSKATERQIKLEVHGNQF